MEEEVILNKILEDANREANEVIEDANKKAKAIEDEQQSRIARKTEAYLDAVEKEIKRNAENEIEKAELESRIAILTKKQEQIKMVKEKVKQKIRDLSVKEMCEIYQNILSQFPNKDNLEVVVQDKNKEEISRELKAFGVRVSDEKADFNYGIIVRDGKVEYNYCFEEIMKFNNEKIEKEIANILFS